MPLAAVKDRREKGGPKALIAPITCQPTTSNKIGPTSALESTSCPLCGSDRTSLVVAASDRDAPLPPPCFTVVRCRECDLCYTNPRPAPAEIGRFYYDDYAPHQAPKIQPKNPKSHGKWRGRLSVKNIQIGNAARLIPWAGAVCSISAAAPECFCNACTIAVGRRWAWISRTK